MNSADALEALSRQRPLTAAEVNRLYRLVAPSQSAEAKRARRQARADELNRRARERYASDPDYRAHRLTMMKATYRRRIAR